MADNSPPRFSDVIKSVLASAFGVQSQKNYTRDFSQHSAIRFIAVGVVFFVLFILALVALVSFVVS